MAARLSLEGKSYLMGPHLPALGSGARDSSLSSPEYSVYPQPDGSWLVSVDVWPDMSQDLQKKGYQFFVARRAIDRVLTGAYVSLQGDVIPEPGHYLQVEAGTAISWDGNALMLTFGQGEKVVRISVAEPVSDGPQVLAEYSLSEAQIADLPEVGGNKSWAVGIPGYPKGAIGISAPTNAFITAVRIVLAPGAGEYDVQGMFKWGDMVFRIEKMIVSDDLGSGPNIYDPERALDTSDVENLRRLKSALSLIIPSAANYRPHIGYMTRLQGTSSAMCDEWEKYYEINLKVLAARCRQEQPKYPTGAADLMAALNADLDMIAANQPAAEILSSPDKWLYVPELDVEMGGPFIMYVDIR